MGSPCWDIFSVSGSGIFSFCRFLGEALNTVNDKS